MARHHRRNRTPRNARKDGNHNEIVAYFEALYFTVEDMSAVGDGVPDIMVGGIMRGGPLEGSSVTLLVEIKNPETDGQLSKTQRAWHARWRGPTYVVRTREDVIDLVHGRLEPVDKICPR